MGSNKCLSVVLAAVVASRCIASASAQPLDSTTRPMRSGVRRAEPPRSQPAESDRKAANSSSARRYLDTHFTVRDIDVANLLRRLSKFGPELPVPVSGRVSADIRVGV